jgi:hypothetical protein
MTDALLAENSPGWSPRVLLKASRGAQNLPADTTRVVTALAYLAPLVDVGETSLTPGTWCWNALLWRNPFLPHDLQEGA